MSGRQCTRFPFCQRGVRFQAESKLVNPKLDFLIATRSASVDGVDMVVPDEEKSGCRPDDKVKGGKRRLSIAQHQQHQVALSTASGECARALIFPFFCRSKSANLSQNLFLSEAFFGFCLC